MHLCVSCELWYVETTHIRALTLYFVWLCLVLMFIVPTLPQAGRVILDSTDLCGAGLGFQLLKEAFFFFFHSRVLSDKTLMLGEMDNGFWTPGHQGEAILDPRFIQESVPTPYPYRVRGYVSHSTGANTLD
jgi:hypothetical protein